jgi:hypothetical protein
LAVKSLAKSHDDFVVTYNSNLSVINESLLYYSARLCAVQSVVDLIFADKGAGLKVRADNGVDWGYYTERYITALRESQDPVKDDALYTPPSEEVPLADVVFGGDHETSIELQTG